MPQNKPIKQTRKNTKKQGKPHKYRGLDDMINVLFICHGNICRSTMAESVMAYLVKREHMEGQIYVNSAATSTEEIGNPPHYGTVGKLREVGIPLVPHRAVQLTKSDYVKYDYNYKIIVIGDSGVGKTCLTNYAVKEEFIEGVIPTVGYDFFSYVLRYKDKIIKLAIWDTCGQEKYRSLIDGFFVGLSLAIIVYAIDNTSSFDSIDEWIRQCKVKCSPETKLILIGNKADLDENQ